MGIAQAKSLLGGLDDTVYGLRVIGIVHRQPVGNPEDRQRDQSLRWRRQIPQFAAGAEASAAQGDGRDAAVGRQVMGSPQAAIPAARRQASGPR